MDWSPGKATPIESSGNPREELAALLEARKSVAHALSLLTADVAATLGWTRDRADDLVTDEATTLVDFLREEDRNWPFPARIVERVQQRIHDEFIDTTWPPCPRHATHPLWITGQEPWLWECPSGGVQVPLGGLGSLEGREG